MRVPPSLFLIRRLLLLVARRSAELSRLPVSGDIVLGCALRRAHLSRADVPDFCTGHPRLQHLFAIDYYLQAQNAPLAPPID